jgi:hypothetical protein
MGKLQVLCMCGLGLRTPLLGQRDIEEEGSLMFVHLESRGYYQA